MAKQVVFSGIQPSGKLHIGNYIGAIRQWVTIQNNQGAQSDFIFMLANLHTITVPQDSSELKQNTLNLAAWFLASGLDPVRTTFFVQSHNPDHSYLTWIFDCITPMGWMERMTQYKDKSKKQGERTSVGLFHYPSLMATDILLYDTTSVPVGEDQTQHVEIARDIAKKFNARYGEIFIIPEVMLIKHGARIMSLQNPTKKMSKSEIDPSGTINLDDSQDEISQKIKRAVTDSGSEIVYNVEKKPAISNLMVIYEALSEKSIEQIQEMYAGKSYGDFKKDLAEVVVSALDPIQKKYDELHENSTYVTQILDQGSEKARAISSKKIKKVREVMGL
ncbi:tryptophan--tRNA ligase [Candidatus Roizmanbacteria bacterium RIFCSPHIGHO2_02_FULL_40_9]|uniref:Tryptophan--tRNA ligase n=1 Tax=Candidatus Roizmanbacteria bacterium RIFCSPHIGHO2_02_FULL_40_9 TaxID=1802042 RepID=A0A1F7HC99_9BACT|nr:MAG: tryptophan--tRNA ligase [Candidatus Roizmanbacteria bacterium RIFCSPHIGHO2_02_FULL_40_9]